MKYKDTFIRYYITNRIKKWYETFLENLNYWWCVDCEKHHSPRVNDYPKREYSESFKKEVWAGITCKEDKE